MGEKKRIGITDLSLCALYVLIAVAVGILLIAIGGHTETYELVYWGCFVAAVALFTGGFLLKEENGNVRLGMLIAGGLVVTGALYF